MDGLIEIEMNFATKTPGDAEFNLPIVFTNENLTIIKTIRNFTSSGNVMLASVSIWDITISSFKTRSADPFSVIIRGY